MRLKLVPTLMLSVLIAAPSVAGARMLVQSDGASATPVTSSSKGQGLINQISQDKNLITVDGMDFVYTPGRTRFAGTSAGNLKAGQQIEYTAVPEGGKSRISEIKLLPSPGLPADKK